MKGAVHYRKAESGQESLPLQMGVRKSVAANDGSGVQEFIPCELLDINQGGVGLLVSGLKLPVLKRVELRFEWQGEQVVVSGVIASRQQRRSVIQYGVIFTDVPSLLDSLLLSLISASQPWQRCDENTLLQRRSEARYHQPQLRLRVWRLGDESRDGFINGSMVDISRTGVGFIADEMQTGLAGEVALQIRYGDLSYLAYGVVSSRRAVPQGVRYGVKFSRISSELWPMIAARNS